MEVWRKQGYFNENEKQFCVFIKKTELEKGVDEWLFIDEILQF